MKRKILLTTISVCCLLTLSTAQIPIKSTWIGGGIGFNSQKNQADNQVASYQTFSINPALGKAVKENLVVGGELTVSFTRLKNTNGASSDKSSLYGAGAFIRKYVPLLKGLYLFGHGSTGFDIYKQEISHSPNQLNDIKGWIARLNAYPGVSFQVNRKLQLETGFSNLLHFQYNHSKGTFTGTQGIISHSKNEVISAGVSATNLSGLYLGFRLLII